MLWSLVLDWPQLIPWFPGLVRLLATNLCFAEKAVYTQEVLAVVLQQLLEQTPVPMFFMRTVGGACAWVSFAVLIAQMCPVLLHTFLGHSECGGVSKTSQLCDFDPSEATRQTGLKVGEVLPCCCCVWVRHVVAMLFVPCVFFQVWKQPKVWQGFIKCCEVSHDFCHLLCTLVYCVTTNYLNMDALAWHTLFHLTMCW